MNYFVLFTDRKLQPAREQSVKLEKILDKPEFADHFPHTVGFFKSSSGEGAEFKPDYMEIRFIGSVDDFCLFLNALNI